MSLEFGRASVGDLDLICISDITFSRPDALTHDFLFLFYIFILQLSFLVCLEKAACPRHHSLSPHSLIYPGVVWRTYVKQEHTKLIIYLDEEENEEVWTRVLSLVCTVCACVCVGK